MDKNRTKSVFKEYIQPSDMKVISKIIEQMKVDRYVKKLDSLTFIKLFIFAQLNQLPSLKSISFKVKHKKKLQKGVPPHANQTKINLYPKNGKNAILSVES